MFFWLKICSWCIHWRLPSSHTAEQTDHCRVPLTLFYFLPHTESKIGSMGAVVGRQTSEILAYHVLQDLPAYEIRVYEAQPIVQTQWQQDSKSTFMTLADYIGAFDEAKNSASQKIAMTAPVECLADRENFTSMRFFPPVAHKTVDSLPAPLSTSVTLEPLPKRYVAARRFSGSVDLNQPITDPAVRPQLLHVLRALLNNNMIKSDKPCDTDAAVWEQLHTNGLKDAETGELMKWSLAVYNPPFCLPFLRRNEIWISLSAENAEKRGSQ